MSVIPKSKSAIGQQKNKPFGDGGAHDSENNLIADAPGQERRQSVSIAPTSASATVVPFTLASP
jgi:hypothetical protein